MSQGSKLKKSPSRLLATNWRNIVSRCKFLVASLYNVNDAAHSISLASDIILAWRSEIPQKPLNHAKYREIR